MRIVFHIGMGKTGTTSIQHALKESADALARQNAAFLSMSLDEINPASTGIANYYRFIKALPSYVESRGVHIGRDF